ncbi:uncharacterized protein LOC143997572 [Lithobates pipiens]
MAEHMADSPDAGPQIVQREEIVEGSRPVSAVTRRRRKKASNMTFEEMVDMVNILQKKDYDCREHVYSNMNIRKDAILEKVQHVLRKRHGSERTKDQLRKRWSDLKLREESQLRKINKIIDKRSRKKKHGEVEIVHEDVEQTSAQTDMATDTTVIVLTPVEDESSHVSTSAVRSSTSSSSTSDSSTSANRIIADLKSLHADIENVRTTLNSFPRRISEILEQLSTF